MKPINSMEDIEKYQSLFKGLWKYAKITVSFVETEENIKIPNGEIIFYKKALEPKEETVFDFENFSVVRKVTNNPFQTLKDLIGGKIEIEGKKIQNYDFLGAGYQGHFQAGTRTDSRVFEERPRSELNRAFKYDFPGELDKNDYGKMREEISQKIRYLDKPFYGIRDCESYFFENYFSRTTKMDPRILLFANTEISFEIEGNTVKVRAPKPVKDKLNVFIYPKAPYGEHRGRKIPLTDETWEKEEDLFSLQLGLDVEGIKRYTILLTAGTETLDGESNYRNDDFSIQNERYRIFNEYDQEGFIETYLSKEQDSDLFEITVMNVLSTAGYRTHWFGFNDFKIPNPQSIYEEIDIIAYAPDGSQIAFIECSAKIEKKDVNEFLGRAKRIVSRGIEDKEDESVRFGLNIIKAFATQQPIDELDETLKEELEEKDIIVLDKSKLQKMLELSADREFVGVDSDFLDFANVL